MYLSLVTSGHRLDRAVRVSWIGYRDAGTKRSTSLVLSAVT